MQVRSAYRVAVVESERAIVVLRPISLAEFDAWRATSIASYANDVALATGRDATETLAEAHRQFADLLPDGLQTKRTWLMRVLDADGSDAGFLWIGPHPDSAGKAYVYDIAINEDQRGRGLGRAAMLAAEQVCRDAGIAEIGLNVFGFNDSARRLYDSLGYRVVATRMTKQLD